jgi:hypothetical protein
VHCAQAVRWHGMAVNCNVSSSDQNLAFNALLFLYRHVLSKD